jgi:tetratricopeptide (TPR) repeat protein
MCVTFIKPYSEIYNATHGIDDEFHREVEQGISAIISGWSGGWFNLALAYDNAGLQRKATAAYARGAKLGDIDAIIEYSDRMWEAGRRAKALQVRSRLPIPVPGEGSVNPETMREKELVRSYWVEVCHHDVTESTLVDLVDLDPELHAPKYAYWLVEHDRYEEVVGLLRRLIDEKDCADLYLPLGRILANHGETEAAGEAYTAGIACDDDYYYNAFNLGLLNNELGNRRQALSLIRLAASHGDRKAVRWLRSERRQEKRRRRHRSVVASRSSLRS